MNESLATEVKNKKQQQKKTGLFHLHISASSHVTDLSLFPV